MDDSNLRKRLLAVSQALQTKHVKIGDFYGSPCTLEGVTEAFGELCEEAQKFGGAGAKNGGLIIDIVQMVTLGWTCEDISTVPSEHLIFVKLNDGKPPESLGYDPTGCRFCGEGEYELARFIECVCEIGHIGLWAVEVINREYAGLSLQRITTRVFDTTTGADFRLSLPHRDRVVTVAR